MLGEKLRSFFYLEENGGSPKKLNKKLLILLGAGVFLLLFNSFFTLGDDDATDAPVQDDASDEAQTMSPEGSCEKEYVDKISAVLSQIRGVSDVKVYFTTESGPRKELALERDEQVRTTTEEDTEGGTREVKEEDFQESYVILRGSDGEEKALVLEEQKKSYRGALVVAEGVEDSRKRARVTEAVKSLLDLPAHRVTVLPRGAGEN